MAELLAEAEFFKKRQSAKIHEKKLNIEEEYARKILRMYLKHCASF